MESQLFTLSKIFTERLFRIPDYQRGYAWTHQQLKEFWSDLCQIDEGRNHYTGVLTLEAVPSEVWGGWEDDRWIIESKGYEPLYIVDGQQRITTSIILINSIIEKINQEDKINFTLKSDIQRKFIFDSKDDGISRSYIFGYEKDNPSYEFLKTKIFHEFSSKDKSEETVYTNNLMFARDFFVREISDLNKNEVELLYKKVTQSLLFNIFTISNEVDVCVAFETMNNRGKPLSYLELLKNRLIYLSIKIDVDEDEREALRRSINDCWKQIYHNLGRNKNHPLDDDVFLDSHYAIYFMPTVDDSDEHAHYVEYRRSYMRFRNNNSYENLLEDVFITKNIKADSEGDTKLDLVKIYDYVSSLQSAARYWYFLFNPNSDPRNYEKTRSWLEKLNRIDGAGTPIVLSILMNIQNDDDVALILSKIERYIFVNSLVRFYLPQHRLIFNNIAIKIHRKQISVSEVVRQINEATVSVLSHPRWKDEVKNQFRSKGFYNWKVIRYFLFEYNLHLQERSKTSREKLNWMEFCEDEGDYVSVEHIYPQRARASYWQERFGGLSQKKRNSLKNALGNLLPLSRPKNSSLSNRPFPTKVEGVKDEVVGYRFGCYAENEVARETNWTPEIIYKRSMKLINFMEKRWSLHLGDESEKSYLMGLDFIKD